MVGHDSRSTAVTDVGSQASVALGFNHAPLVIGNGELKHGLGKIDGIGSSIHVGLLTLKDLFPTPMKTSKELLRQTTGESIPSVELTLRSAPELGR